MSERTEAIAAFLAAWGWQPHHLQPLAGDASFRRYARLAHRRRRAILMDAPPEHESVTPFVRMARHLRTIGLSAPEVIAADEEQGLLLLEDLGDDTFSRLLAGDGAGEEDLYRLAVDVLAYLHTLPAAAAIPEGLPAYDSPRLLREALLLTDWYWPARFGQPIEAEIRDAYCAAWTEALPAVLAQAPALVLRDFHVDNLMRLSGRSGLAACGLLDFQDAVSGAAAYDLMSLLEDARRDVSAGVRTRMRARYAAAVGLAPDDEGFAAAFAVLAAQRHAKVIGIFTRLCWRDGKPAYLVHLPRVWRLLTAALDHPALRPVRAWFDRYLPAEARGIPPQPATAQPSLTHAVGRPLKAARS